MTVLRYFPKARIYAVFKFKNMILLQIYFKFRKSVVSKSLVTFHGERGGVMRTKKRYSQRKISGNTIA